jgi:hypothetical protein
MLLEDQLNIMRKKVLIFIEYFKDLYFNCIDHNNIFIVTIIFNLITYKI